MLGKQPVELLVAKASMNQIVKVMNEQLLQKMEQPMTTFHSINSTIIGDPEDAQQYPPEFLCTMEHSNLPQEHCLNL